MWETPGEGGRTIRVDPGLSLTPSPELRATPAPLPRGSQEPPILVLPSWTQGSSQRAPCLWSELTSRPSQQAGAPVSNRQEQVKSFQWLCQHPGANRLHLRGDRKEHVEGSPSSVGRGLGGQHGGMQPPGQEKAGSRASGAAVNS